jgi:Reverse transcriptase (RNA-dependent DNA polymerase)
MKLDEKSQPLTTFTIPGKGQFQWVTSPMGLLGCPASFQQLMEGVLRNLQKIIIYIDDLLIHSQKCAPSYF